MTQVKSKVVTVAQYAKMQDPQITTQWALTLVKRGKLKGYRIGGTGAWVIELNGESEK